MIIVNFTTRNITPTRKYTVLFYLLGWLWKEPLFLRKKTTTEAGVQSALPQPWCKQTVACALKRLQLGFPPRANRPICAAELPSVAQCPEAWDSVAHICAALLLKHRNPTDWCLGSSAAIALSQWSQGNAASGTPEPLQQCEQGCRLAGRQSLPASDDVRPAAVLDGRRLYCVFSCWCNVARCEVNYNHDAMHVDFWNDPFRSYLSAVW